MEETTCTCLRCGKQFEYNRKQGHRKNVCGACSVISWRLRQKHKAVEYKGGKCEICGYDKCIGALEFHHLDPKEKEFALSQGRTRAWEKMKKELDKCILLCANCHREAHTKEQAPFEIRGQTKVEKKCCKLCGEEFVPCKKTQKYCSPEHGFLARRRSDRPTPEALRAELARGSTMEGLAEKYKVHRMTMYKWLKR